MPSPTGAETSGAAFNGGRNHPRKNVKILNERQKRPRKRAASIAEIKMRKTLVTILCCSALTAASSIEAATAAERHQTRNASRKPVIVNDQRRNSNNEQPRDSSAGGTCGIFPGPCQ